LSRCILSVRERKDAQHADIWFLQEVCCLS